MTNRTTGAQLVSDRILAASVVEATLLWANTSYSQFLGPRYRATLEPQWFSWFLGEWKVARTIKKGMRQAVITYLNSEFANNLTSDKDGSAIDVAAAALRRCGLTAGVGKDKVAGLPVSLVSKVAFLFYPDKYPPLDRFGKKGLNRLRGTKKQGGRGCLAFASYQEYLSEFNGYFIRFERLIRNEIDESWHQELTRKFGLSSRQTGGRAFRRKVLDNVLMNIGRL